METASKILEKGDKLFSLGDTSEGMYVVKSGKIEIFLENQEAKLSLAILEAGSVIGEMSLFEEKPRSASAVALEKTELTYINQEQFEHALEKCPKWFTQFVRAESHRLRSVNEKLGEIQDSYLFKINQLKKWIELLYGVDLLFSKKKFDSKANSVDRFWLEEKMMRMFSLDTYKVTKFLDILVEGNFIEEEYGSTGSPTLEIKNEASMAKLFKFLHSLNPMDQSKYCNLDMFQQLVYNYNNKIPIETISEQITPHSSVQELAQAATLKKKGECRRQHFRIIYKEVDHPTFVNDHGEFEVIDISETGIRFKSTELTGYDIQDEISGTIKFPGDRGSDAIIGQVVRVCDNFTALNLKGSGRIPLQRVMSEQRVLIQSVKELEQEGSTGEDAA